MGKSLLRQDLQRHQPALWLGDPEEGGWEWVFRQPYGCIQTCLGMVLSPFWHCPAPIWIDLRTVGQKVGNSRIFMLFIAE